MGLNCVEAHDRPRRGRLAAAVGSEEPGDLAAVDREAEVVDGGVSPQRLQTRIASIVIARGLRARQACWLELEHCP